MATKTALRVPEEVRSGNVVEFRLSLLPRHGALLNRWLEAGRRMGLCDASVYPPEPTDGPTTDYVLVWVRENSEPAYMVTPEGMRWVVTDCVRHRVLARVRSFGEALHLIRPVLDDPATA